MRKNDVFIEKLKLEKSIEKHYQNEVDNLTPKVYAAIALALHRTEGFGYTRIRRVFAESQEIWQDSLDDERSVIQICSDETGIDVVSGTKGGGFNDGV